MPRIAVRPRPPDADLQASEEAWRYVQTKGQTFDLDELPRPALFQLAGYAAGIILGDAIRPAERWEEFKAGRVKVWRQRRSPTSRPVSALQSNVAHALAEEIAPQHQTKAEAFLAALETVKSVRSVKGRKAMQKVWLRKLGGEDLRLEDFFG